MLPGLGPSRSGWERASVFLQSGLEQPSTVVALSPVPAPRLWLPSALELLPAQHFMLIE